MDETPRSSTTSRASDDPKRVPVLYTGREWLEHAEPAHIVWPFWGASHWQPRYDDLFADFLNQGAKLFQLADDPNVADYFLPPCGWQHGGSPQALRMAELASRYGKPLLVFFHHDSDEMIPVDDRSWIFRTSMDRSTKRANEQAWPAWTCDVLRTHGGGRFTSRVRTERPVVGYCGYIDYRNVVERVRRSIRGSFSVGSRLRGNAIRALAASREVDSRFILRRKFGGHSGQVERDEYARNMLTCDYAVVARGNGNFSFRLYEVMSAATIPVFIDTDCCLPFDDVIPYRELFVWVPVEDVHRIADYVLRFHAAHDTESLNAHRRRIRGVYDRYLEPLAFHRELSERLTRAASHGPAVHE
jgi:hypothetical protein